MSGDGGPRAPIGPEPVAWLVARLPRRGWLRARLDQPDEAQRLALALLLLGYPAAIVAALVWSMTVGTSPVRGRPAVRGWWSIVCDLPGTTGLMATGVLCLAAAFSAHRARVAESLPVLIGAIGALLTTGLVLATAWAGRLFGPHAPGAVAWAQRLVTVAVVATIVVVGRRTVSRPR